MQAYARTSPQVVRSNLPSPLQNPSGLQPAPTSQSGYYSVQQSTFNQYNTPQSLGRSCSSSSKPNSSLTSFQPSPPGRNNLPGPQQTLSTRMPDPTPQTAYYRFQQPIQFSNHQSPGLSNGQSFYSSSEPNAGLANLQSSQGRFSGPRRLSRSTASGSSNASCPNGTVPLQQMPAARQNFPAASLHYYAQSAHTNATVQHYNNMPHLQRVSGVTASSSSPPVSSSGSPVLETNQLHVSAPSRQQQASRMQTMHQPAPPPQQMATNIGQTAQIIIINQGQTTAVQNGASYDSTAQPPAVAQMPMAQSMPPPYKSHVFYRPGQLQYNVNTGQNSSLISQESSSYRPHNTPASQSQLNHMVSKGQSPPLTPQPALYKQPTSAIEELLEQILKHCSSVNSRPHKIQRDVSQKVQTRQAVQHCKTVPLPGHRSKISLPSLPAHQYNRAPHGLKSNSTTDVLTRNSQDTTQSCTLPSSEAPRPVPSPPVDYFKVTLSDSLHDQEDGQVLSPVATSIGGQRQTIAGPIASVPEYTRVQAPVFNYSVSPNPGKGEILKVGPATTKGRSIPVNGNAHGPPSKAARVGGAQFSILPANSGTAKGDRHVNNKRHRKVEVCTDPVDCLEVVAALQKTAQQIHRAVAVVPPISHPGKKEDVEKVGAGDSLPFKIDAVWTLFEGSETKQAEANAPSLPKERSKELLQTPHGIKPANGTTVSTENCETVPVSEKSAAAGSRNSDIAQTENGAISKSQSYNMHQALISSADLTAKAPVQPNDPTFDSNVDSCSYDAMFDFSTVPVIDFTLDKLQHLVKSLEAIPVENEKELAVDVIKRILDLYWDGAIENVAKEVKVAGWAKTICELSVKEKQAVVFQCVEPENLKRLACHYVLKNKTVLPAKKFKSSWLNVDEKPADIDKVLAEPISDYAFTWCQDTSQPMCDGTVNPVDHLVQVNNAGDLVVSTQNISDNNAVNPVLGVVQVSGNAAAEMVVPTDKELSETTLEDTVASPVDGLVQVTVNDAIDLVVSTEKEFSETTLEDTAVNPVDADPNVSETTTENIDQNVPSDLSPPPQTTILESNDVIEQKRQNENQQAHLSDSDLHVEIDGNSCEKGDLSSADLTSDSLLMDVILLSTDDATTLFKEQKASPKLCQDDPKVAISSISQSDNLSGATAIQPCRPTRFTCPHVTDIIYDGDHFCSKCWDETPLLNVDLDDPLSPKEDGPCVTSSPLKPRNESCSPQSDRQTIELIELLSPDANGEQTAVLLSPKADAAEITKVPPKPDDRRPSSSPKSCKPPHPEPLQSASPESSKSVTEDVCEVKSSTVAELPKTFVHTKKPEKVKPPQPKYIPSLKYKTFKKPKLSKTRPKRVQDVLFTPDVIKKTGSQKHHSGIPSPASSGTAKSSRDKRRKERKESRRKKSSLLKSVLQANEQSIQAEPDVSRKDETASAKPEASSDLEPTRPKNLTSPRSEGPECSTVSKSDTSQQQEHGCKKTTGRGLSLYGSRGCDNFGTFLHQCHDGQKSSSAPIYVTVSTGTEAGTDAGTDAGRSYTDVSSAKQKIYRQWFSSFVEKQNTSSRKRQKQCKNELKKVIELQKHIMQGRMMSKAEGEKKSVKKGLKHKGDFAETQEAKKLRCSFIEDYFACA